MLLEMEGETVLGLELLLALDAPLLLPVLRDVITRNQSEIK